MNFSFFKLDPAVGLPAILKIGPCFIFLSIAFKQVQFVVLCRHFSGRRVSILW